MNGKTGVFPSNFVQVVEELEPSVKNEHIPGIDFFLSSNQAPLNKTFVYPNPSHECWTSIDNEGHSFFFLLKCDKILITIGIEKYPVIISDGNR